MIGETYHSVPPTRLRLVASASSEPSGYVPEMPAWYGLKTP